MDDILTRLPEFVQAIEAIREIVLANVVLLGQIPSPTFQEQHRTVAFLERLAQARVDECTTDGYRNPLGIVRGTDSGRPPIFVVAHLDTPFGKEVDHDYTVGETDIVGPGILDNSVGVGVLASLPQIFRHLDLRFASDIALAGVIQSMGKGNLRGVRHLLKTWPTPISGAVVLEGFELGRLDHYSDGMLRAEIECRIRPEHAPGHGHEPRFRPNPILVLNEAINRILEIRLPQRPRSQVIVGRISGGLKHGVVPYGAQLGIEIQSTSHQMVKSISEQIHDLVTGLGYEHEVDMDIKIISNVKAARLPFHHPLVKAAGRILSALGIQPSLSHSESELSVFLSHHIPAVALGLTFGENLHQLDARMEIAPLIRGIAQVLGVLLAIDSGICHG
jgi:acetylornithine deacetylase/succinyl-diaminopimelate desuccinylase-like protein